MSGKYARPTDSQPLNSPIWKALDPGGEKVDCGEGAKLAVHALWMLGIPSAVATFAYPTGGLPPGDKDASSREETTCSDPTHGTIYLRYEQSNGGYLNNYEGCFSVVDIVDGGATKYLTVWDRLDTVADPLGLLKLLHKVSDDSTAFNQWWSYGENTRVKDLHDHPNAVGLPNP
jgi:hypothetical protein